MFVLRVFFMYMFSTDSEAPGLLSLGRVEIKKLNLNKPPDVYNKYEEQWIKIIRYVHFPHIS